MNLSDLLATDGPVLALLTPIIVCVVAAVVVAGVLRIVGQRLLEDPAEVAGLARITLIGITAVGVLLGLGRLVDREATDSGLSDALAGIMGSLPKLTISFVLLIVALLVAAVLRATVMRVVGVVRPSLARIVGAVVYWTVVGLVSLIAAEQAGMDVGVLRQLLLITFGGLVAAAALGLGLGMRSLLGSVIAGRHVEAMVRVGEQVRLGDVQGQVQAIGHVSVTITDAEGHTIDVPHTRFLEAVTVMG